jgi:hypothetical protein
MIFLIGPCFPFGPFNALAMLCPWLSDWLQGQHAKLIRRPGVLQGREALAEPRPLENGGPPR